MIFQEVSSITKRVLKKRTTYSDEQYIDIEATVTNEDDFTVSVVGSQRTEIHTSFTRECLEALVKDLTLLLKPRKD